MRCLEILELSASLDEKATQMEEFIFTLSSCSNGSLSQEMSVYSMWTDTIQISYAVTVHRKRVQLMRRRRETLSREGWTWSHSENQFLILAESGLRSSFQSLEKSFLKHARGWLLGHFAAPLALSPAMRTGDIDPSPCRTQRLVDYRLTQADIQSCLLGYHTIWRDLELSVSAARSARDTFLAWGVWAGALPSARVSRSGPKGHEQMSTACKVEVRLTC